MKTLKFFSILFLTCFIVSGLTVFSSVPSVSASDNWTAWNGGSEVPKNGISEYNPKTSSFNDNPFFAYAYFDGDDRNINLIIGSVKNETISQTYTLDLSSQFTYNLRYGNIALYVENNFVNVYALAHSYSGNNEYINYVFSKFSLNSLDFSETNTKEYLIDSTSFTYTSYYKFGTFYNDGNYTGIGFFIVCNSSPVTCKSYVGVISENYIEYEYFSQNNKTIPKYCFSQYSDGKVHIVYAFKGADNFYYVNYNIGGAWGERDSITPSFDLSNLSDFEIAYYSSVVYSMIHAPSVSSYTGHFGFNLAYVDTLGGTRKEIYYPIFLTGDSINGEGSITDLYTFTYGSSVLPRFTHQYRIWYNTANGLYYYVYLEETEFVMVNIDYPKNKNSVSNLFFGNYVFGEITSTGMVIWINSEAEIEVPAPSFEPIEPTPSGIGDENFSPWLGENIEKFVRWLVPLIFILIPALMLAVFFGGMGLIVGALLGSIAGTIAGVIPSWAFVILLVGIVAMLFVGRSRSGNSGVSE